MDHHESEETYEQDSHDIEAKKNSKGKSEEYEDVNLQSACDEDFNDVSPHQQPNIATRLVQLVRILMPLGLLIGFNVLYFASLEACPYDLDENPVL